MVSRSWSCHLILFLWYYTHGLWQWCVHEHYPGKSLIAFKTTIFLFKLYLLRHCSKSLSLSLSYLFTLFLCEESHSFFIIIKSSEMLNWLQKNEIDYNILVNTNGHLVTQKGPILKYLLNTFIITVVKTKCIAYSILFYNIFAANILAKHGLCMYNI